MKFKYFLITIGLMAIATIAYCQTNIDFSYDASGNRIERVIDLNKSAWIADASNDGREDVIIDRMTDQEVKIYPNPTKGKIKIEIPSLKNKTPANIQVSDISGRFVFQQDYRPVQQLHRV